RSGGGCRRMDQLFAHDRAETRGTTAQVVGGRARPESRARTFLSACAADPTRVSSLLLARQRPALVGGNSGGGVATPNSGGTESKADFCNLPGTRRAVEGIAGGLG